VTDHGIGCSLGSGSGGGFCCLSGLLDKPCCFCCCNPFSLSGGGGRFVCDLLRCGLGLGLQVDSSSNTLPTRLSRAPFWATLLEADRGRTQLTERQ
jgi:hypothetical protein